MTVSAAFRIEGIPAMVGDFLVTDNDKRRAHSVLSTRPDISSGAFAYLPHRLAGLRRKIHIFNDGFVAGFSGSLIAGAEIFRELEDRFSARAPSIVELSDALDPFNKKYSGSAYINGWTMRTRPSCFEWAAAPGSRASGVEQSFIGSGAEHFKTLINGADARGYSRSLELAWEKAVLRGVTLIGALVSEELLSGRNLEAAYGFGGDLVLQTAAGFRCVEKFSMLFWNIKIQDDGTLQYFLPSVSAVYENKGRYSLLQIAHLVPTAAGVAGPDIHLHAITPIHDEMKGLGAISERLDIRAPFIFVGFSIMDSRTGRQAVIKCAIQAGEDAPVRFVSDGGGVKIELVRSQIEPLIRSVFD